jgi:hypothetical protein
MLTGEEHTRHAAKPDLVESSTPEQTIVVEEYKLDCEIIVVQNRETNAESAGARQRKTLSSLLSTSDSLWQELELELDKAGVPAAALQQVKTPQRKCPVPMACT